MSLLSGVSEFFGLDIGTSAIRLVELRGHGPVKTLVKYAYAPVDIKISQSDAKADQDKLGVAVETLINEAKMTTRNVAVGIPSQKVFTTVIDIDRLEPKEMAKSIRYQADSLIPTPLADSKIDWAVIGDSPKDKAKVELLLSSVNNEYTEKRLDILESIGLNVIAFEPDNLALARALVQPGSTAPAMVLDIGRTSTDLVVVMKDAPRLTRSIPTGTEALVKAAAQNLNIDMKQAEEVVFKFGIDKTKLESQVYQAIIGNVDLLVGEVDKSINFFESRNPTSKLDRIIVTGAASTLPEFPLYVANKFGINVEIGNSWRNVSFSANRENELQSVSNYFGVATGLAEREE
ncbi:MAG TPA: type IV pilus assembly protein PilM [Candidatus Saccharimonadales bacterium]|nr:type IV pilus assembly protein PilM [Candidatus Saccharimonadales bacterium]